MDSYPEIKEKHIVSMCSKINVADNITKNLCFKTCYFSICSIFHFTTPFCHFLDRVERSPTRTTTSMSVIFFTNSKLPHKQDTGQPIFSCDNTLATIISGTVIQQIHCSEVLKHILCWLNRFYLSYWKTFISNQQ